MPRTTTLLSATVTAAVSAIALLPAGAGAAANMTPDYEVKLLMNPATTLGSDNKPTPAVLSAFGAPSTVTKMNVQFLDTSAKDIYDAGWSPRIRKTEGESGFELTYKKRYPVGAGGIDGALSDANADGLDANDTTYDAQIEWGYQKQTLSISRKKSATRSGYSGMDLPNQSDSRSMLISNAPDQFDDWLGNGWGTGELASSRIFGPVLAKRSVGTWKGRELDIEVWPIKAASGTGTEYLVEASFKTTSRATASADHDALQAYLQSKGWFLAQDSLKTQQIMDRY
ncbi:hypothetical protein [Patulibacter minatonensis]|uniref:hypothetical protein n=1 Tax=Patulibacter minatonensis TaxID=298163 RepID=UPI000479C670|nr:hypothetical protein [Patulibacter minatonensis]